MDNHSGLTLREELLAAASLINVKLPFLIPICTDSVQLCDSFIIQKIEMIYRNHWELYRTEKVPRRLCTDFFEKAANPGKAYFLGLAGSCVRKVNYQRDETGQSFARKAMILIWLAKNLDGVLELLQLKRQLQDIVKKNQIIFDTACEAEKTASCEWELHFCDSNKDLGHWCVCHFALCLSYTIFLIIMLHTLLIVF